MLTGVRLSVSFSLSLSQIPRLSQGPAPFHTSLTLPISPIHFLCDISRLALSTSSRHVGISRRLFLPHALSPVPGLLPLLFFSNSSDGLNGLLYPYCLQRHIKGSHSCITHLFRIPFASLAYDGSSSDTGCVWAAAARLTATAVSTHAAGSRRVTLEPSTHLSCELPPSYCVQRRNTRACRSSWVSVPAGERYHHHIVDCFWPLASTSTSKLQETCLSSHQPAATRISPSSVVIFMEAGQYFSDLTSCSSAHSRLHSQPCTSSRSSCCLAPQRRALGIISAAIPARHAYLPPGSRLTRSGTSQAPGQKPDRDRVTSKSRLAGP